MLCQFRTQKTGNYIGKLTRQTLDSTGIVNKSHIFFSVQQSKPRIHSYCFLWPVVETKDTQLLLPLASSRNLGYTVTASSGRQLKPRIHSYCFVWPVVETKDTQLLLPLASSQNQGYTVTASPGQQSKPRTHS